MSRLRLWWRDLTDRLGQMPVDVVGDVRAISALIVAVLALSILAQAITIIILVYEVFIK